MESTCIRCGRGFASDTWDMDLCPQCDNELSDLENDEDGGFRELDEDEDFADE